MLPDKNFFTLNFFALLGSFVTTYVPGKLLLIILGAEFGDM